VARIPSKNELLARLWFNQVRKPPSCISQGKDLATRERQGYGLKAAKISLKSQLPVTSSIKLPFGKDMLYFAAGPAAIATKARG
jgi:hypothetical protein